MLIVNERKERENNILVTLLDPLRFIIIIGCDYPAEPFRRIIRYPAEPVQGVPPDYLLSGGTGYHIFTCCSSLCDGLVNKER